MSITTVTHRSTYVNKQKEENFMKEILFWNLTQTTSSNHFFIQSRLSFLKVLHPPSLSSTRNPVPPLPSQSSRPSERVVELSSHVTHSRPPFLSHHIPLSVTDLRSLDWKSRQRRRDNFTFRQNGDTQRQRRFRKGSYSQILKK